MKKVLVLMACVMFLATGVHAEDVVRLASLDWQPYTGKDMAANGYAAEIVREAYKRVGYKLEIDFLSWDDAVNKSKSGEYDGLFPEYAAEERGKDYVYSNLFSKSLLVFATLPGSGVNYTDIASLQPYKIGVVSGYVNSPEFDSAKNLTKVEAASDEEGLKNLFAGKVDMIVIDALVANHIMQQSFPGKKIEMLSNPLYVHDLFIVFSKKAADYQKKLDDFNRGLAMIQADGTVNALGVKYGLK